VRFKNGQPVRMVWKSFFCGGSNKGVVVRTTPRTPAVMVRMSNGDLVVHQLSNTEICEVVPEEEYPEYCVKLGARL
jgi:hypothetical protein